MQSPSTAKKKTEMIMVWMMIALFMWTSPWAWAMSVGMRGVKPNKTKLMKVTTLLVKGFYPPARS